MVLPKIEYMDRPSAFSISLWFYRRSDISGDDNDTNHQVNNVLVAQSSNLTMIT